jgi:hypothetical protein
MTDRHDHRAAEAQARKSFTDCSNSTYRKPPVRRSLPNLIPATPQFKLGATRLRRTSARPPKKSADTNFLGEQIASLILSKRSPEISSPLEINMHRSEPVSSPSPLSPRPLSNPRVVVTPLRPCSSRSPVAADLDDLRSVAENCLAIRQRDAIYLYFNALNETVSNWERHGKVKASLHECLDSLKRPIRLNYGEAYSILIHCSCPAVDDKMRSKWARALRYADEHKRDDETVATFIKRKGGINACTALYAREQRKR